MKKISLSLCLLCTLPFVVGCISLPQFNAGVNKTKDWFEKADDAGLPWAWVVVQGLTILGWATAHKDRNNERQEKHRERVEKERFMYHAEPPRPPPNSMGGGFGRIW